jgi:predicted NAD-dependent protein-ADP-ribosyltransferase YbiA (DUF1768 family)
MAETEGQDSSAAEPQIQAAVPVPTYTLPTEPYDKATQAKIKQFYKQRRKLPAQYTYTKEGNLEVRSATGEVEEVTQLKRYVPLEAGERDAMDEYRLELISEIETEYEQAIEELRMAWEQLKITGARAPVLRANQRVAELDARRNAARSAVREVFNIENPETREILFDEPYETRKLIYDVITSTRPVDADGKPMKTDPYDSQIFALGFRNFPAWQFYGKYIIDTEAPPEKEEKTSAPKDQSRTKLKDGRIARIFFDTDGEALNGYLSPLWPVRFTFHDVESASALQAYEIERATLAGLSELRETLKKTTAPRTIRILTRKYDKHPPEAKSIWLAIYTALYQQHPELAEKLLATGTDTLIFADQRPGPLGVGLGPSEQNIVDATKWKGDNAVGLALETLRTRLRSGEVGETEGVEEAAEAVITAEEQEKAKKGAIINAVRGGFRRR